MKKRLDDQHKKIVEIQSQNRFMQIEFESDINRLDEYSRRSNIEIAGIPDSVGDNELEKKVLEINS